jgi:hypothetical protein
MQLVSNWSSQHESVGWPARPPGIPRDLGLTPPGIPPGCETHLRVAPGIWRFLGLVGFLPVTSSSDMPTFICYSLAG